MIFLMQANAPSNLEVRNIMAYGRNTLPQTLGKNQNRFFLLLPFLSFLFSALNYQAFLCLQAPPHHFLHIGIDVAEQKFRVLVAEFHFDEATQ